MIYYDYLIYKLIILMDSFSYSNVKSLELFDTHTKNINRWNTNFNQ